MVCHHKIIVKISNVCYNGWVKPCKILILVFVNKIKIWMVVWICPTCLPTCLVVWIPWTCPICLVTTWMHLTISICHSPTVVNG
jgi:uncharacterized membrane-anchored protein